MGANKMDIWLRANMQNVTRWAPSSYQCDKLQQVKHEFCRGSQSIELMIGLAVRCVYQDWGFSKYVAFPSKTTTI